MSIFNIAGRDGLDDFEMIVSDQQPQVNWAMAVEDEFGLELEGEDKFDPNDNSFEVRSIF